MQGSQKIEPGMSVCADGLRPNGACPVRFLEHFPSGSPRTDCNIERLADDGWPEDAGSWPERTGGATTPLRQSMPANHSSVRILGLLNQWIESLFARPHRTVIAVVWRSRED